MQTGDAVEWLLAVEVLPVALRTPCLHTIPFVHSSTQVHTHCVG